MADETATKEEVKTEPQTEPVPIETTGSEPSITPSEPLESSTTIDTPSMANNDNKGIIPENNPIIPTESEKTLENQAPISEPNEIKPELEKTPENPENTIAETINPIPALESPTAQIPVSEPLASEPEIKNEPKEEVKPEPIKIESKPVEIISETKPEPVSEPKTIPESKPEPKQETKPEQPKPIPEVIPAVAIISKSKSLARELLVKARNIIQFRKRKKLDKVMSLFLKHSKITNDEVEKFLHISDATTGRYLAILVKEGKIKQTGKTGKSVFYSKL